MRRGKSNFRKEDRGKWSGEGKNSSYWAAQLKRKADPTDLFRKCPEQWLPAEVGFTSTPPLRKNMPDILIVRRSPHLSPASLTPLLDQAGKGPALRGEWMGEGACPPHLSVSLNPGLVNV